jgi:hypothetical protein
MRALLNEGARFGILLGLSPWILPLIAIAAKRKAHDVDGACCARLLRGWLRMNRNAGDANPADGSRDHSAMTTRIKAPRDSTQRD